MIDELNAIFKDIDKHITEDSRPSLFLNQLLERDVFYKFPFSMLSDLKNIEQSPVHHPEGNVWNHTLLVLDNAAVRRDQVSDSKAFMWSALLHDIGKTPTTKIRKGRITAYDHDRHGEEMAVKFLKTFTDNLGFIKKVAGMVRWHMQILYVLKELPFANISEMLSQVDLNDIAVLSLCDRLGRGQLDDEKIKREQRNVEHFKEKCLSFMVKK